MQWEISLQCLWIILGGRGLFAEQWTQTSVDFADRANIAGLSSSAADYVSSDMDSSSFVNANKSGANVLRLTGYFVPSITAPYRFLIMADGYASLNFSPTGPPADQVIYVLYIRNNWPGNIYV